MPREKRLREPQISPLRVRSTRDDKFVGARICHLERGVPGFPATLQESWHSAAERSPVELRAEMTTSTVTALRYLEDRWDDRVAGTLDEQELLRYRSNLLGSDLRITNFGGGNTSSKITETDPLDGTQQTVLWVKGSGGDLGSIKRGGFATLYLNKLLALASKYRGVAHEDEMVELYPLCTFGKNSVATSIDTPLHGFLPFAHVDHLHPDWAIALAAAANGHEKLAEFNARFARNLIWLPWQRPGFELGMMLRNAVLKHPECDGVILGGHGLFTWGHSQRECYLNTIAIIDQLGQFVQEHVGRKGEAIFGGARYQPREDQHELAIDIFPYVRGRVSVNRRMIGTFTALPEVLRFINSSDAQKFSFLGTSCPDHFVRTKIRPMYVPWNPEADLTTLRKAIDDALAQYRHDYGLYYRQHAKPDDPAMRDANPTVVLIPGIGMFSFGKNKTESRITGEFYVNAIHVMEGASALESGSQPTVLPQAGPAAESALFQVHCNYVALPPSEAFRIEYWALEEAKIQRQPAEKELSRRILLIVGGGSGIGREVVRLGAARGAHVVAADRDLEGAQKAVSPADREFRLAAAVDIRDRSAIRALLRSVVAEFGGLDIIVNTAAIFPFLPGWPDHR